MRLKAKALAPALLSLAAFAAAAAEPLPPAKTFEIPDSWRQPVEPFQIADHTWYIGTQKLSALLVKTDAGAVLIDGGLPQAADYVLANLRQLGVEPDQVKLILHSHAHADHVGPLAALKRLTGATLVSNAESAVLLARGGSDDLHFGDTLLFPPVRADRLVMDREVVALGRMQFRVHFTPAHTPGSMSWAWTDTRDGQPLRIAYVDSFSAPGYRLADNPRYPRIVEDFHHGFSTALSMPCDLLITPHPDASGWQPELGRARAPISCDAYVAKVEKALETQLRKQRGIAQGR